MRSYSTFRRGRGVRVELLADPRGAPEARDRRLTSSPKVPNLQIEERKEHFLDSARAEKKIPTYLGIRPSGR